MDEEGLRPHTDDPVGPSGDALAGGPSSGGPDVHGSELPRDLASDGDGHPLFLELRRKIREDPEILRFIEDSALDGIWFWDLENPEHEWMSPRFWEVLGVDPATKQHVASEWQDLIHPDDLKAALRTAEAHFADPEVPYDQQVRYRHADGSTVWVRCRGRAVRDERGRPVRMLGAHTDVTELKRTERRLRSVLESFPGIVFVLDEHGVYRDVATNQETLLAVEREDLVGKHVRDVLPPDLARLVLDTIARTLEQNAPVVVEYRAPGGADGFDRWLEARVRPVDPDAFDTARTVVWYAYDISTRKAADAELQRKNDELRRFSYVAAHDLRSPLHAILQLAGFLEEDLGGEIADESRKHLGLIEKRARRMQLLLDGLLEYARAVDRVELHDVEVGEVVAAALELAPSPGPGFEIVVEVGLPRVHTDPVVLQLVFQNLIANALNHHDRDSGTVRVGHTTVDGECEFFVTDDGPGIPERAREDVFRIFRTVGRDSASEGTGVGLSIVQKAIDGLGGKIWIEAPASGGTTFRFRIPQPAAGTDPLSGHGRASDLLG
ncbi:MAG: PAS domain-containing protein [Planctomycetota bacterium]